MSTPLHHVAERAERSDRAVIATDLTGEVVFWGSGAEQLYGWTAEEALGRDIVDLTPADMSRDQATRIMDTLQRGEPWSGDFLVQSKEGKRFVATVIDIPVTDDAGDVVGILGISRRSMYMPFEGELLRRRRSDRRDQNEGVQGRMPTPAEDA